MDSKLIVRNESERVAAVPLDEAAIWEAWRAKGRVRDSLIAKRIRTTFVATSLLALVWFWFRLY